MGEFNFLYCDKCGKPFSNIYQIAYCWDEVTDYETGKGGTSIINLIILHKGFNKGCDDNKNMHSSGGIVDGWPDEVIKRDKDYFNGKDFLVPSQKEKIFKLFEFLEK